MTAHARLHEAHRDALAMPSASMREPNFALFFLLSWLLVVAQLMAQHWALTAYSMHDADDALRLVQVRSFIAGQGWFDLHEARLGPPLGYDSHWSRLIDAGLAGLFFVFNAFVDREGAERLMAAVWPVLWLIPTIGGAAAIAWRIAGREAAFVVLLLAVFATPGMGQFRPGRIDHHNVQIALAMLAIAATVWSDRRPWCAIAAGAVTGLALAIGLESLHVLTLCGAGFALRFVADRSAAPALRAYGASLAASTLGAFLVTVAPEHWTRSVCDTIAINSAGAAAVGGLGLAVAARWSDHLRVRGVAILVAAAAAAATYILAEPRCLGGPYAMVDPAILPIWFVHVAENQSLPAIFRLAPVTGMAIAAFPILALLATGMLAGASDMRRNFAFLVAGAIFLAGFGITVIVTKAGSYVLWLGVPLVAAAAVQLYARIRLKSLLGRFFATLLITPTAVTLGAMETASALGVHGLLDVNSPARQACIHKDNYAALARLPAGLVVANELEWGSFLLAWTPHSALAAPYHRMSSNIVSWNRIFAGPPDQARRILREIGADYVAICGPNGPVPRDPRQRSASLLGQLRAGNVPDWLESVPEFRGQVFAVYRVRR